jgi:hypothetical protein
VREIAQRLCGLKGPIRQQLDIRLARMKDKNGPLFRSTVRFRCVMTCTVARSSRPSFGTLLARLESLKESFGAEPGEQKLVLLTQLRRRAAKRARDLLGLHEILCFLLAYPDNRRVRALVEQMLAGFDQRADLRRFRCELSDTGIAGTRFHYEFFWPTALWLARNWPGRLEIEWSRFKYPQRIESLLLALLPYAESILWDERTFSARDWLRQLKRDGESDGAFLVRRFEELGPGSFAKEAFFESLQIPMVLLPDSDTPSRTRALFAGSPVVFQEAPRPVSRPKLRQAIRRSPRSVKPVSRRDADKLIELARGAMVTRQRDLNAIAYASRDDVRLVDWGNGLQFAWIGAIPQRRYVLETVYVFLTLQNGVPVGYVQGSAWLGSAEVNYNIFDTYRGAGAAHTYGCALATIHHLLGTDAFVIDSYQIGNGNPEALKSGAWWFYYKLGFRPRDPDVKKLVRQERDRMSRNPGHRSSRITLKKLATENLYFFLGKPRADVLSLFPTGNLGAHVSRLLSRRFGSDRGRGIQVTCAEAAERLGVPSLRGFSPGERLAWQWWSPLILCLPGVDRWKPSDRQALLEIVRAKGAVRETEYARLVDRHLPLRRALSRLAATDPLERRSA